MLSVASIRRGAHVLEVPGACPIPRPRAASQRIREEEQLMSNTITVNVNGKDHAIDAPPDSMLLYALRNDLKLHGPKFGCGLSECGACTVIMDGSAIRSCVVPLAAAAGHKITTLEGLGSIDKPHPLQQAFIDEQA